MIITLLLSAILLMIVFPATAISHRRGDVDFDGEITIIDATTIQKFVADLITDSNNLIKNNGDVDGDGLSILDASLIQKYLAHYKNDYNIGESIEETSFPTEETTTIPTAALNDDGKSVTIDGITFDISRIPDSLIINNSQTVNKSLILKPDAAIAPEDFFIQVNNGSYDFIIDYSDETFKENYLMTVDNKPAIGYDCLVRNEIGEEVAWVSAHYESDYAYPFRATVWGLKCQKYSFPIDFYYKGCLIKRCNVTIDLSSNHNSIEKKLTEVRKIENQCWTQNMSDQEKLKAFSQYVANHYSYTQVMCVTGAEYVAFAARDLGLTSMLLYPGGEENQPCGRHIVTYNIYYNTAVPGGHCACLVYYPDGSVFRFDVQGGSCWIREYY